MNIDSENKILKLAIVMGFLGTVFSALSILPAWQSFKTSHLSVEIIFSSALFICNLFFLFGIKIFGDRYESKWISLTAMAVIVSYFLSCNASFQDPFTKIFHILPHTFISGILSISLSLGLYRLVKTKRIIIWSVIILHFLSGIIDISLAAAMFFVFKKASLLLPYASFGVGFFAGLSMLLTLWLSVVQKIEIKQEKLAAAKLFDVLKQVVLFWIIFNLINFAIIFQYVGSFSAYLHFLQVSLLLKQTEFLHAVGNHEKAHRILNSLYLRATESKDDELFKLIFNNKIFSPWFSSLDGRNKLALNLPGMAESSFENCYSRFLNPYCAEGLGEVYLLRKNQVLADMYFRAAKDNSKALADKIKVAMLIRKAEAKINRNNLMENKV